MNREYYGQSRGARTDHCSDEEALGGASRSSSIGDSIPIYLPEAIWS
jgi:hypothetical protein